MKNEVLQVIKNHRSVRHFSKQPVAQEVIVELIEAAQMAASSSFIQAYSVIQVSDQKKREQLRAFSGNQSYVEEAPVFLVFCADLYRLQMVIREQGSEPDFSTIENLLLTTIDTALFAQNFMLAAEAGGLGGVYIGGLRNSLRQVSELLVLPELVVPLFGICLGYPDLEKINEQKKRLPISVVLHQDAYQKEQVSMIKEYDAEVAEYYSRRTNWKRTANWSSSMANKFLDPIRPNVKEFLLEKGFSLQ